MDQNHPTGFCQDMFSLVVDHNLKTISQYPENPTKKSINLFHFTDGNEKKIQEMLDLMRILNLVSKKFSQLTHQYIMDKLEEFITPESMLSYTINTNKNFYTHKLFLPICQDFNAKKTLFRILQWSVFYQALVVRLRESSTPEPYKKPKKSYLIKASKNALKYTLETMYYKTITQLQSDQKQGINKQVFEIYKMVKAHGEFNMGNKKASDSWLDKYIESKGSNIPKLSPIDKSPFVFLNKKEQEKLYWFIKKHSQFCLNNKNKILYFLNQQRKLQRCFLNCQKKDQKQYLIARFLIIFNSIKNNAQKEKVMVTFFTQLSNSYWYGEFNFY